tara:strand:- start:149 stop:352 length:204 start_codon:yes stop_codon:yes gene_type:complete
MACDYGKTPSYFLSQTIADFSFDVQVWNQAYAAQDDARGNKKGNKISSKIDNVIMVERDASKVQGYY